MTHATALELIGKTLSSEPQIWADLGAGTGLFTEVLRDHLPAGSQVYALDKSPHALWYLAQRSEVPVQIVDADFTRAMPELPTCDALLMANALHYVAEPMAVLPAILAHLKPGGRFVLIEYEVQRPVGPYIPHPLPFKRFASLCREVGLGAPQKLGQVPSQYGHDHLYSVWCEKK